MVLRDIQNWQWVAAQTVSFELLSANLMLKHLQVDRQTGICRGRGRYDGGGFRGRHDESRSESKFLPILLGFWARVEFDMLPFLTRILDEWMSMCHSNNSIPRASAIVIKGSIMSITHQAGLAS